MYVISHWDLDGLASAALLVRTLCKRNGYGCGVRLSTINALPNNLFIFLNKEFVKNPHKELIIADLNPLPTRYDIVKDILATAIDYGIRVHWFDHHNWFPEFISELTELGVNVVVDPDSVTAEIIAKTFNLRDSYSMKLVELAIDDDLFLNRNIYTVYWRRVLRWFDWKVRYKALNSFIAGIIWPEWASGLYGQIHEEYRRLLNKALSNTVVKEVNGFRIAVSYSIDQRIHAGEIQEVLMENGVTADLYIVVYPSAISLRSTVIDVSKIAKKMGGGGHPRASGIPLNNVLADKVINKILKTLENIDVRKPTPK